MPAPGPQAPGPPGGSLGNPGSKGSELGTRHGQGPPEGKGGAERECEAPQNKANSRRLELSRRSEFGEGGNDRVVSATSRYQQGRGHDSEPDRHGAHRASLVSFSSGPHPASRRGPPTASAPQAGGGGDSGILSRRRHRRLLSGDFKLLSPTLLLATADTWKFPHGVAAKGRSEL